MPVSVCPSVCTCHNDYIEQCFCLSICIYIRMFAFTVSVIPSSCIPQCLCFLDLWIARSGYVPMTVLFCVSQCVCPRVSVCPMGQMCLCLCPSQLFLLSLLLSVQFSSVTQSCPTLCNPVDCSASGLPVHHQLSEFTQTHVYWACDAIQQSHPLSSPSPPAFNLSQHQGLFKWVSSSHQVAKTSEFQPQHQSSQWILRTDFL